MKKFGIALFTLVGIICGLVGLAACEKVHTHTFGEWTVVTETTCLAEGLERRVCSECNDDETRSIAKLAHTPQLMAAQAPTCTEDGHTAGTICSVCGSSLDSYEVLAATGHAWGDWTVVDAASCIAEGLEHRVCGECGEEESSVLSKTEHSYGRWTVAAEPTCAREGLEKSVCSVCFATETRTIEKLAHTPITVSGYAADCDTDGLTDGVLCDSCGEVLTEQKSIPMLGHDMSGWEYAGKSFEGRDQHRQFCRRDGCGMQMLNDCGFDQVVFAATCEESGYHIHTCLTCKYTYQHDDETAPKLGHSMSGLLYDAATNTHRAHCLRDGCTYTDDPTPCLMNSEVVEPTCILSGFTAHTCSACGGSYTDRRTEPKGHSWGSYSLVSGAAAMSHEHTCDECGVREEALCSVTSTTYGPTCTETGYVLRHCVVCSLETRTTSASIPGNSNDPLGHALGSVYYSGTAGNDQHSRACTRANCDYTETEACTMVDASTAPTCSSAGDILEVCRVCLHTNDNGDIPALEHDWGAWQWSRSSNTHVRYCNRDHSHVDRGNCSYDLTVVDATCTAAARTTYTCSICNNGYTSAVGTAYGHRWSEWAVSDSAHTRTCDVCETQESRAHDFGNTNICGICLHDGLGYALSGGVAYVSDDNGVQNAKHIIVSAIYQGCPVTRIKGFAFNGNRSAETIELPYTVEVIGDSAFYGCERLHTVTIGDAPLTGDGFTSLGNGLNRIGTAAFSGCKSLTNINLPATLVEIGISAFSNCTQLLLINIPENVTEIGDYAFNNTAFYNDPTHWVRGALYINKHLIRLAENYSEGEYTIHSDTRIVSSEAFKDCLGLTRIIIPASVTGFNYNAFAGCANLYSVIYQGDMRSWFAIDFNNEAANPMWIAQQLNIQGAHDDIVIPEHVTKIPAGTFRGSSITSVTLHEGITSIGAYAFYGCSQLAEIVIPDTVVYIGEHAFENSKYYETEQNWSDGLLYINNHLIAARAGEISTEITLREGTRTVSAYAFRNCINLVSIEFSETLCFIGTGAFEGCTSLKSATFKRTDGYWLAWTVGGVGRSISDTTLTESASNAVRALLNYLGEWKHVVH